MNRVLVWLDESYMLDPSCVPYAGCETEHLGFTVYYAPYPATTVVGQTDL